MTERAAAMPCDEAIAQVREFAAGFQLEAETVALARTHRRVLARDVQARPGSPSPEGATAMEMDGPVLRAGQLLTPVRVALAASLGAASLEVARRPTVAVYTVGDALVPPGMPLAPGQAYDSQRELLMGLLRADGLEPTAWPRLPADPTQIEIALRDAGCAFDLVMVCAAAGSTGHDAVAGVLARYGRPLAVDASAIAGARMPLGHLDQACLLGLPDGPWRLVATYLTFGHALIDGLQGRREPRPLWYAKLRVSLDPTGAPVPARLSIRDDGTLEAEPLTTCRRDRQPAAIADALILPVAADRMLPAGAIVPVLRFA